MRIMDALVASQLESKLERLKPHVELYRDFTARYRQLVKECERERKFSGRNPLFRIETFEESLDLAIQSIARNEKPHNKG